MAQETANGDQQVDDVIALSEAMAVAQSHLYSHGVEFLRYRIEVEMTEGGDSPENPLRRTGRRYAVTRRPVEGLGGPGTHEMMFCPIDEEGRSIG